MNDHLPKHKTQLPAHYYCSNLSDSVSNLCDSNGKMGSKRQTIDKCADVYANHAPDAVAVSNTDALQYRDNRTNKLLGKPPIGEKIYKNFYGVSLDEREMPITRDRQAKGLQTSAKRNAADTRILGSPQLMQNKNDSGSDRGRVRYSFCGRFSSAFIDFLISFIQKFSAPTCGLPRIFTRKK